MAISEKRKEYNRKWYQANREHIRAYRVMTRDQRNARRRELYAQDPERRKKAIEAVRRRRAKTPLIRRVDQYEVPADVLEHLMNEGCAICGANPLVDPTVRLHVDHDHRTGAVRGVLCQSCNLAIGHFHDDPIIIAEALHYLLRGGSRQ